MVRTIGFGITDLADEKSQFATYYCVTMGKGLNCSSLSFLSHKVIQVHMQVHERQ